MSKIKYALAERIIKVLANFYYDFEKKVTPEEYEALLDCYYKDVSVKGDRDELILSGAPEQILEDFKRYCLSLKVRL